jgi:hypothetical protein
MEEQNMADPAVLTAFINWATQRYPAEHYVLVLWNHGSAWKKNQLQNQLPFKGVISDDTSNSMMTIPQVSSALTAAGKNLDIIGMDACLMATLEVAYQLKTLGSYLVTSEESEPGSGWPYTQILTALTGNANMTAAQLGQQIVSDFIANTAYDNNNGITQSATDLSKINDLATKVNELGEALVNSTDSNTINNAKNNVQKYSYEWMADLYHFASLLSGVSASRDANLVAKANAVKSALSTAVIASDKRGTNVANSYGLTIYLPTNPNNYDSEYDNLAFTQAITNWKSFITHSYSTAAPVIQWVRQTPGTFTLNQPGKLEVYVTDADGAADIYQVWFYANAAPDTTYDLHDDGSGYDTTANDGIYSIGIQVSGSTNKPQIKNNLLLLPESLQTRASIALTIKASDTGGNEDSEAYNLLYSQ